MLNNETIKLIDFGFSKVLNKSEQLKRMKHTVIGTRYYASPQILDDGEYSGKNDVWSAGIILYEMLVGKKPWEVAGNDVDEYLSKIKKEPLKIPEQISSETKSLLSSMLEIDEEKRLSWDQISTHAALKDK